jgi:hypothetical protein
MNCQNHSGHEHKHGPNCGHKQVKHDNHTDYLHDGHLHHVHEDHVDEHQIPESGANVSKCTPDHACHDSAHKHAGGCGHEAIPHGDHVDYLVDGHLHHPCQNHCDDHGAVA